MLLHVNYLLSDFVYTLFFQTILSSLSSFEAFQMSPACGRYNVQIEESDPLFSVENSPYFKKIESACFLLMSTWSIKTFSVISLMINKFQKIPWSRRKLLPIAEKHRRLNLVEKSINISFLLLRFPLIKWACVRISALRTFDSLWILLFWCILKLKVHQLCKELRHSIKLRVKLIGVLTSRENGKILGLSDSGW